MNAQRTARLVELWISAFGSWHLLEAFDSTAQEFARSLDPPGAAARAAWRTGLDVRRTNSNIRSFELRTRGDLEPCVIVGEGSIRTRRAAILSPSVSRLQDPILRQLNMECIQLLYHLTASKE